MGLRERKRRETYLRIEDEATRLFLEKSYEAVTLEEICEAAVVSRRTFFNYFQSKDHVAIGHMPSSMNDEDYNALATMTLEKGQLLSQAIMNFMSQRRIDHETTTQSSSINPSLSEEIAQRRVEILRRNPTLGLSKLNGFETMRRNLVNAITKNLEAYPAHRTLPDTSVSEEASITVVAIVTTLWTSSMLVANRSETHLTQDSVSSTIQGFATMYEALSHRTLN